MMKRTVLALATVASVAALGLAGCRLDETTPVKNDQAERARKAANSIRFTGNAEIENIKRRLELTSKPGLNGFVMLLNGMGQPVAYLSVRGKITSSGKRLTPSYNYTTAARCSNDPMEVNNCTANGPSDEGTYGSSDPYVFFWDSNVLGSGDPASVIWKFTTNGVGRTPKLNGLSE